MLIGTINLEVLLEGLAQLFSLAIAFWVVPGGEMKSDVKGLSKGLEEVQDTLQTSVGSDVRGAPCLENTWRRKSYVSLGDIIMS